MLGITLDMGCLFSAESIRSILNAAAVELALFQTDITPSITDDNATYLDAGVECDFPGYARITLDAFGAATIASHIATIEETLRVFTATGISTNDVYGYFIVTGGGDVLWAERDPMAPINMRTAGASYAIVPSVNVMQP